MLPGLLLGRSGMWLCVGSPGSLSQEPQVREERVWPGKGSWPDRTGPRVCVCVCVCVSWCWALRWVGPAWHLGTTSALRSIYLS